ncbi:prepilin-type N-terminal cleavage/methylation domain-containing protein [Patescibacteria group bacterium]|nr:prepilin-type N-terminal cleavage/methylation domain-containing protein [Patescibacteria group bacterium]
MNKRGFGLIGILIVVTVVAILAIGGFFLVGGKDGDSYVEEKLDAVEQAEKVKQILENKYEDNTTPSEGTQVSTENNNLSYCETKLYSNNNYGFQLKYPACDGYGSRQNSLESGGSFQIWQIEQEEDKNPADDWSPIASLFISVDENPDGLSIQEYYDGEPGVNLIGQTKPKDRKELTLESGLTAESFEPFIVYYGGELHFIVDTNEEFFISFFARASRFDMEKILNSIVLLEAR